MFEICHLLDLMISFLLWLFISTIPRRPSTDCPKRSGAFWFFTTEARTLSSFKPPLIPQHYSLTLFISA